MGLTSHPSKLEFGVEVASKWGVQIHGGRGEVRAPPTRALFLSIITAEVARLGLATTQLLESLVDSWISVFLQRRRALCTVDLVYDSLRGRAPTDRHIAAFAFAQIRIAVLGLVVPTLRRRPPRRA